MKRISSTGDSVLDAICSEGLFELLIRADPFTEYRVNLSSPYPVEYNSQCDARSLKSVLEIIERDEVFENRLNMKINVGKPEIAYNYFVNKVKELDDQFEISLGKVTKHKETKLHLLPMSVMPVYGKGLRAWSRYSKGESARVELLTIITYFVGLAYYGLHLKFGGYDRYILIIPPVQSGVNQEYMMAIRRISDIFNTSSREDLRKALVELPKEAVPLLLFSLMDTATLRFISDEPPQLLLFSLEKGQAARGQAAREYELISTHSALRFFCELGDSAYSFKLFFQDLVKVMSDPPEKSFIYRIMMEFSRAIEYRNPDLFNLALHQSISWKLKNERYGSFFPSSDDLERAVQILICRAK
jgi:hypothetical protein